MIQTRSNAVRRECFSKRNEVGEKEGEGEDDDGDEL